MSHARMFNAQEPQLKAGEMHIHPTAAWEQWRTAEEKRRYALLVPCLIVYKPNFVQDCIFVGHS